MGLLAAEGDFPKMADTPSVIPRRPPKGETQVQRLDMGPLVDHACGVAGEDKVLSCGETRSNCLGL